MVAWLDDILGDDRDSVAGARDGTITIFAPHTTVGITALEFETGANRDLAAAVEAMAPTSGEFGHNKVDSNGHAHVRGSIVGPSLTVPLIEGRPALGQWQTMAMIDFDDRPRKRTLILSLAT